MKVRTNRSNSRKLLLGVMLVLTLTTPSVPAVAAATQAENEALANMVTVLFRAARKVVSDNQPLINDPEKGDKGLNAEKVVAATKENFAKAAGKEVDSFAKGSLSERTVNAMLQSVGEVVTQNQELINQKGVAFKGFIPASFARQVATEFTTRMKGSVEIKLTAPKAIIRNRANRPDDWEHAVMEQQFKKSDYPKGQFFAEMSKFEDKPAYRFISPEYYVASCLNCHGDPKGARDISGHLKEGSKLGDLGGSTSVVIF